MTFREIWKLISQGGDRIRIDDFIQYFDVISRKSSQRVEDPEKAYLKALTAKGEWLDFVDIAHMVQRFSIENAHTDPIELNKMFSRIGCTRLSTKQATELMRGLGIQISDDELDSLMCVVFGEDCDGDLTAERLQTIFQLFTP